MFLKLTSDVDVMFELTCLSHEWPVGIIIGDKTILWIGQIN